VKRKHREREKKGKEQKKILGQDAGFTVLQLYLIKGSAALIWLRRISPNILQNYNAAEIPALVGLRASCLKHFMRNWGDI